VSFLSPIFLTLGLAAAIPLILHLLRRRVGTRMDFPAVRYLLRAEQENRRTMRLRNLLLMLLRVAVVLLLTMAAARPVGRMIGRGHAPAAVAILIDNTVSSAAVIEGRSVLDRFKSAAIDLVGQIEPADNIWLITADGTVAGGTPATMRDAIAAVTPTSADADLAAATRRAMGLARAASQSTRALVILTDGQKTSWPSGIPAEGVSVIVWAPELPTPKNHSVSFAEARPSRWSPRGEVALRVSASDSLTYRVTLAARTLARGTAGPGAETIIRAAPSERGWLGGSVDLAPDELAADDIRYFATWIGPAPSVAVTPGAGEFIVAALDALRSSSRIVTGREIAAGPADEIGALPALITVPADPVHLGASNRALERLGIPWRFGARRAQAIDANVDGLDRIAVTERYELQAQSGALADTVGRVANAPWIVAGPKFVLIGSPLVASATTLPLQAGFLPWLSEIITDRLSGDRGSVVAAAPGTWVKRPAGVDQLERPDGSMIPVADSLRVPPSPGVYFFVSAGRRTGAIVVNPPARESQLDRMSVSQMQQLIPGATVVGSTESAGLVVAFKPASTRSLLPAILLAGLVALLAESVLVTLSEAKGRPLPGRDRVEA
jgi:hypothetical protein